ncbi:uncharacterized protein LOC124358030 isoform X1 [Homalodisca vitripennis]|uniref:uncharacterized protein LOC124358030 isoform X1 n=1 Tax=Homalodisca vitripennis TaxID=197043 RepID=UPI001EEAC315|nr:uncharacterized protein LOC124358030 isoform X1 [Homalodisca vitripennis]
MKLIVLSAFCVIAFTTFSEVAGFDSAEKEDVSEIQNGTYSSGELKDIDYDLDTTRGPVDPSNPPTAPTPAGPVLLAQGSSNSGGKVPDDDPQYCHHSFGITPLVSLELRVPKKLVNNNCQSVVFTVYAIFSAVIFLLTRSFLLRFLNIH